MKRCEKKLIQPLLNKNACYVGLGDTSASFLETLN